MDYALQIAEALLPPRKVSFIDPSLKTFHLPKPDAQRFSTSASPNHLA
jgi:hypothetical protein